MSLILQTVAALSKAALPRTHAFITGCVTETRKARHWGRAGHLYGNHTFGHLRLSSVSAEEYIADIDRNEINQKVRLSGKGARYFRYPYLDTGDSEEKYSAVAAHLKANGYSSAPASVPFGDHRWSVAYDKCLSSDNRSGAALLRENYVAATLRALKAAELQSQKLYNRVIPLVMLLHFNNLEAEMLPAVIAAYKKAGVRFVGLEEALKDSAYHDRPGYGKYEANFYFSKVAQKKGISLAGLGAGLVDPPEEKFASFCP